MAQCRMCGDSVAKLVKAHAIPAAFFRTLNGPRETPLLVSGATDKFNKAAPLGVYDEGILCAPCEGLFQHIDDYGISVLLKRFDELSTPLSHDGLVIGHLSTSVDQDLLLRFLVAVLWRASASTQNFYHDVELGPYEELAARVVTAPRDPVPAEFGAVLSRWSPTALLGGESRGLMFMDPRRGRLEKTLVYRLYLGEFLAYVRVGKDRFSPKLAACELRSSDELKVTEREFDQSKDFGAMRRTAQAARQRDIAVNALRTARRTEVRRK